jgi:Fe2+ transport system protein B
MPTPPKDEDASDAAAAFRTLNLKIAGLTAAIEGFAARQQEIQGRDYSADLARIYEQQDRLRAAMNALNEKPAMALTPEKMTKQVTEASYTVRERDYKFLNAAIEQYHLAAKRLSEVVKAAKTAEEQKKTMIGALALGLVLGIVGTLTMLDLIDRVMPASWHAAANVRAHSSPRSPPV